MANLSSAARGVRKGSWTDEEDELLHKCIQKYGEGNWHSVPLRAGLNRCRKSCRLRWTNYLKPNIKRGRFSDDEVDLILRLHKLLGNKWSLIAGRLPGRTANDIKNYWNSHLHKKFSSSSNPPKNSSNKNNHNTLGKDHRTQVIRPQAQTFSKISTRKPQLETRPRLNSPTTNGSNDQKPLSMCSFWEEEEEEEEACDSLSKWLESILQEDEHFGVSELGPGPGQGIISTGPGPLNQGPKLLPGEQQNILWDSAVYLWEL